MAKLPFLKNFRRGFATNSSSSHSFVYMKDVPAGHDSDYIGETEFQWNDFRLDTIREKLFYVLSGLIGGGWNVSEEDIQENIDRYGDQFPELTEEDFRTASSGYGVDHDSNGLISAEQARDPKLVVFGGNDNEGISRLRAEAIRDKEIDWDRTEFDYYDEGLVPDDDEKGKAAQERYRNRWN